MKYLEEYNFYEDIIENLEDYLQEFFDKHNIIKGDGTSNDILQQRSFYLIKSTTIIITVENRKLRDDLYLELKEMRPTIEKRINKKGGYLSIEAKNYFLSENLFSIKINYFY